MSSQAPLLNGVMPRRFRENRGVLGVQYRNHYLVLMAAYGPFGSELLKQAAADAAQCHCIKLSAVAAWEDAQTARMNGKGRRPNTRLIVQLAKRVALESQSYTQAVNRLEALLKRQAPAQKPSVANLFAVQAGA